MRETGILNREISDIISSQGHMDELIVCDAGFPIPLGVRTIDISLAKDKPTVPELIEELLKHHSVEKVIMANQTKETSPSRFKAIVKLFGKGMPVETIDHSQFKLRAKNVKAVIRTGDFTAYSNVLMVSGAGNRWYCEK